MKNTARRTSLHSLWILASLSLSALADKPLEAELNKFSASMSEQTPQDMARVLEAGMKTVEKSGVVQAAKQVGDAAPDFTLKNATGAEVNLKALLAKGPVVLTWYRGGWCPYCNLSLAALQKALPDFQAAGAQLVALTPELPDKAMTTAEKNGLKFEVLTDLNHQTARDYGIVYQLPANVAKIYKDAFKLDLAAFNGSAAGDDMLPLAATYVIDQSGIIRHAFLTVDYRKRAEPSELVEFVKTMKSKARSE